MRETIQVVRTNLLILFTKQQPNTNNSVQITSLQDHPDYKCDTL